MFAYIDGRTRIAIDQDRADPVRVVMPLDDVASASVRRDMDVYRDGRGAWNRGRGVRCRVASGGGGCLRLRSLGHG